MESLMNDLRRGGDDLTTGRSLRLASRPPVNRIFEVHGQSLVSGSQQKKGSDGLSRPVQKFKPAITTEKSKVGPSTRSMTQGSASTTTRIASTPDNAIELSDSQSEDEMDLFSSHRDTADDHSMSQKRIAHTQYDGHLDEDGEFHPYLKGFEPKQRLLSTLKFNKNKEVDKTKGKFSDTALSQPTQPTSPLPTSLQAKSRSKGGDTLRSSSKSKCDSSTSKGDTIYVNRPSAGRLQASSVKLGPREEHPSESKHVVEKMKIGPPSRSVRPRIKRTNNPEGSKRQPKGFSTSNGQISSFVALNNALLDVESQRSTRRRSPSSGMSLSRLGSRCSSPKVTARKPEAFPTLSPPSSPALPKRQPEFFPPLSPLTDSKSQAGCLLRSQKRRANPFPMLSPPSKGEVLRGRTLIKEKMKEDGDDAALTIMVSKNNGNGKERACSAREKTRRKLEMFPMNTPMLQSTDSSPTTVSPWGKRSSEGSGGERISKRSKKERAFPQSSTRAFEEEGDSLLFSPEVDPRSLCPYCDTPLPEHPSSLLRNLIAATRKKASPDPRPSNPLGLKAPVAVFVTVCQRHRFESQILPEAEKKGWPKTIEWNKVANRVMKMENVLRTLLEDPGDDSNTGDVGSIDGAEDDWEIRFCKKTTNFQKKKGPKANSIFWNEVVQEIKEKGSRVVAGVRGQFANFEKAQPGYYGEQGSVIIHQTLYDMFPPSSMDASLIAPLTGNEFMEKILVPEVALRLIMQDKNLRGEEGKKEALTALRESSSYGVFMFPEDGGEWGGRRRKVKDNQLGVGDMIVMQRAMKRRKELEEGEEGEERILQSEQEREAWSRMDNKREKEPASTQPKPRPLRKASSAMEISSSQDDFPGSHQRTKESRSDFKDTDPEISDEDGGWRVTWRSPSAGETKRQRRSMHSTSRGINLSSDTDTSSRAVVGTRPLTRSRSRSVVCKAGNRSSKMEADRVHEDIIKTPMPARCNAGLEDDETPQASRSPPSRTTPPLMRARRRHNKVSVEPFRQNYGTSKPPLPTRIHLNYPAQGSQDTQWLLEDESS